MSQWEMDTFVNQIGKSALQYYHQQKIWLEKLKNEVEED